MNEGPTLAALRVLGMSHPTVTRRIGGLEHLSRLRLPDQTTQGICPTSAATALLPEAERREAAAEAFGRIATREWNAPSKPIRIRRCPIYSWRLERISPDQIVSRSRDFESLIAAVQAGRGIGARHRVLAQLEGGFVECYAPEDIVAGYRWLVESPPAMRGADIAVFARSFAPDYATVLSDGRARIPGKDQGPGSFERT